MASVICLSPDFSSYFNKTSERSKRQIEASTGVSTEYTGESTEYSATLYSDGEAVQGAQNLLFTVIRSSPRFNQIRQSEEVSLL